MPACLPHLHSYNNWCLLGKPAHLNRFHCQNARVRNFPQVARAVLVKLMRSSKASATDWGWPAAADSSGLGNRLVAGGLLPALIGRGHPVPNTPTLLWLHPSIFKAPGSHAGFFLTKLLSKQFLSGSLFKQGLGAWAAFTGVTVCVCVPNTHRLAASAHEESRASLTT